VALAEAGSHVVLSARNIDALNEVVSAMKAKGLSAEAMVMDVADTNAIKETIDNKGPFDILVNSAGLGRHSPSLETSVEDFDKVMDVNLRGAYFLTQAVARGLIEANKPGSLINISSQMGHVGGVDRAVYAASKHAVEGFTKAMAIEWGRHQIRVNTICPTFIRTPLTQSTFDNPKRKKWIEEKIKLGRVGEVQDVMGAVVFLASEASSMITGSALMIDGGWTAD
jgi:NAD(P)-dependent dehydrogenase (short-subunit alcohol dehydrogenase family)